VRLRLTADFEEAGLAERMLGRLVISEKLGQQLNPRADQNLARASSLRRWQ